MMATSPVTDPPRTPSPADDEPTPRETEAISDPLDQIAEPPASLLPPHVAEIPRVEPPRPISPRPVTPKPFVCPVSMACYILLLTQYQLEGFTIDWIWVLRRDRYELEACHAKTLRESEYGIATLSCY